VAFSLCRRRQLFGRTRAPHHEDSGLVEPFLKENGYTFPVLPAYGLVSNMFASSFGIPQTWIIDSQRRWQWTEMGFTAESNWEDSIILKLEAANIAKN
jgi:hypothetical protein